MKYSYLVILSFLVLLTALCYVFWWNKVEEESAYLQEDTRLILTAEYLKKHPRGIDQSQEISDSAKYVLYVMALYSARHQIHMYPSNFVVVNLVDETNGIEKEICIPSFRLRWLIAEDMCMNNLALGDDIIDSVLLGNKGRRFCFQGTFIDKEPEAINYSSSELAAYRKLINIDSVKEAVFTNPFINYTLADDYSSQVLDSLKRANWDWNYSDEPDVAFEEERMLAHIMFNYGIPMAANHSGISLSFNLPEDDLWMDWIYQETKWKEQITPR